MNHTSLASEIAQTAASMVVEEGLEYGPAKRRALKQLGLPTRTPLPDNQLLEAAVREHLTVFCGDTIPRHNIGAWPVRQILADAAPGTRAFHSAKDREMTRLAGAGIVVWDGVSQGSRANIRRLCERGRHVLVYLRPMDRFVTVAPIRSGWRF